MRKQIIHSQTLSRFVTGTAIVGLLLSTTLGTAQAGITVNINENGSDTENGVDVEVSNQNTVTQTNTTAISNDVNMDANTGKNTVSKNTGTSVDVKTGDVQTDASISNTTGGNTANVSGCSGSCSNDDIGIGVSGNGSDSTTNVDASFTNNNTVNQQNNGDITNDTKIDANTGYNTAVQNTGGNVSIKTGSITGSVDYNNVFGTNHANVGNNGWDVAVDVSGNGANSNVNVSLDLENNNNVDQSNSYSVHNNTDINSNTGGNDCVQNTSADCSITTGDITFGTSITNQGGSNDVNIGGVDHTDHPNDPSDDDDDQDPSDDDKDTDDDQKSDDNDDDKSIIDKILDKLVPDVQAETTDNSVLGAMELPETGLGTPMSVSWFEVIIAMYLVAVGAYVRNLAQRAQSWAQRRADR